MRSQFEIWKWIPGYEGYYQVSNCGNVKSVDRYIYHPITKDTLRKGKYLKYNINKAGYALVRLYKNKKGVWKQVHRLVAEAFIPNPDNLPEVNHKDENKANNWVTNLEWCTRQYNINYGTGIERCRKKRINGKCSKTVCQYSIDGQFIREWPSISEAERQLGFDKGFISACCLGKQKQAYGYIWHYRI